MSTKAFLDTLFDTPGTIGTTASSMELGLFMSKGIELLSSIPSPRLQPIMKAFQRLLLDGVIPIIQVQNLPRAGFLWAASKKKTTAQAAILLPPNWREVAEADETTAACHIVDWAARSIDFYNGKIEAGKERETDLRAIGYVVEFLRHIRSNDPTIVFGQEPTESLSRFPEGLDSPEIAPLLYTPRFYSGVMS